MDSDSFDIVHRDNNSGSFLSNGYSFLPEVMLHSVQNEPVTHMNENFNLSNIQSALSTVSPDVSIEEVTTRLMELVDVNQSLKEALHTNNLLLKTQLDNLPVWQENKLSFEKTKENISVLEKENADLRRRLSSLETECQDLKSQKSCKKCECLAVVLLKLKKDKEAVEKNRNLLLEEINKFNNFHETLRYTLMAMYDQLNHLYHTGKHTDRQKEELNNVLLCLNMKICVLTESFCSITHTKDETDYDIVSKQEKISDELMLQTSTEIENLGKELEEKNKLQLSDELMHETFVKINVLRKESEEENKKFQMSEELILQNSAETKKLKEELEIKNKKLQLSGDLMSEASAEINVLRKELEEKNEKLQLSDELIHEASVKINVLRKELEEENKKFQMCQELMLQNSAETQKLKEELEVKNKKLDFYSEQEKNVSKIIEGYAISMQNIDKQLKSQHEKLKIKLKKESKLTMKYKTRCQELPQQMAEYQVKLKSAETSNDQSAMQLCEENLKLEQLTKQKDMNHMEHIDHLTARVLDLELTLEEKGEEMEKVLQELDSMKEQSEIIPILQAQVEVYKTDLEHAVSTRDSAHFEIENLEKELKKYRKEYSDASGYYSTKKRNGQK